MQWPRPLFRQPVVPVARAVVLEQLPISVHQFKVMFQSK